MKDSEVGTHHPVVKIDINTEEPHDEAEDSYDSKEMDKLEKKQTVNGMRQTLMKNPHNNIYGAWIYTVKGQQRELVTVKEAITSASRSRENSLDLGTKCVI